MYFWFLKCFDLKSWHVLLIHRYLLPSLYSRRTDKPLDLVNLYLACVSFHRTLFSPRCSDSIRSTSEWFPVKTKAHQQWVVQTEVSHLCFSYAVPWARLCFSGTGPGGLWWRSPGPGLRWRSPESPRSGRARRAGASLVALRRCKPRGRPRRGLAARPVATRKQGGWRKSVQIKHTKDLEAAKEY